MKKKNNNVVKVFKVVKNSCNNVVVILDDGAGGAEGPPLLAGLRPAAPLGRGRTAAGWPPASQLASRSAGYPAGPT